jgi:SAM-dependent methyltransferase
MPENARELVVLQRTGLLPARSRAVAILQRLEIPGFSYRRFAASYVQRNSKKVDSEYFSMMEAEAEALLAHVPSQNMRVLDIGAGLAGVDLFLSKRLKLKKIILLDKSSVNRHVFYGFKRAGSFYNSLELAKELLVRNGVAPSRVVCMEAPDDGEIDLPRGSVDLVLSTLSWGFHYPVSFYLESVRQILSKNGVLIIDVRKNQGGLEALEAVFSLKVIGDSDRAVRVVASRS